MDNSGEDKIRRREDKKRRSRLRVVQSHREERALGKVPERASEPTAHCAETNSGFN